MEGRTRLNYGPNDSRTATCTVPEDWRRCTCKALSRIYLENSAIYAAARVIDAHKVAPVAWHGQTRREQLGHCVGHEAERYRQAFDWAIYLSGLLDEDRVRELHDRAVGGFNYRRCHLWVSGGFRHPEPDEIPKLMQVAFRNYVERCRDWPSSARALGLHLDLLTAHPFRDGNGRTARLAAAVVLAQAGFKSTVFTAVEEHFRGGLALYLQILEAYRYAQMCRTRAVAYLVAAMSAAAVREAHISVDG
jgi:hypothetical protein